MENIKNKDKPAKDKSVKGKSDCRIIFSDIDGTILNSSNHVSENTKKKILELEEKGILFILVSARMPDGVRLIRREIGNHSPIVCYSGGLILDEKGEILSSTQMDIGLALEIKELLEEHFPGICCNTYGMNQWVVDDDRNPWVVEEERITRKKASVGKIREAFSKEGGIHKFLLMGEPEVIVQARQMLSERYPKLTVSCSKETYLEVMDGSVKKSEAVRFLCRYYGILPKQAMAFGDGDNDVDMLNAVGYGYAMANAPESVKSKVRWITAGNDEEGVFQMIRRLG